MILCSADLSCTSGGKVSKEKGSSISCPSSPFSSSSWSACGWKNGLLGELENGSMMVVSEGGRKNEESSGAFGGASMWSGKGTERNC